MKTVKVYLQDGYNYTTQVSSKCTNEEIQQYYYHGAIVNIGRVTDDLKRIERIEIIEYQITAKDICLNDWYWMISFPLIGFSILLFVVLHIN